MEHKNILSEVEKTLNSYRDTPIPEPDMFFYTRVMARIDKQKEQNRFFMWLDTPYLKPAIVAAILVVNIMVAFGFNYFNKSMAEVNNQVQTEFYATYSNTQNSDYLSLNELVIVNNE